MNTNVIPESYSSLEMRYAGIAFIYPNFNNEVVPFWKSRDVKCDVYVTVTAAVIKKLKF